MTRTSSRFAPWVLACGILSLSCGSKQSGEDAGPDAGCDVFDAGPLDPNLVSQGSALVLQYQCEQCHGAYLEGNSDGVQLQNSSLTQYPPNLTPDPATGLGCWTNEQVENAILNSIDNQGNAICGPMPHFIALGLTQADALAIVTYLRSLPPEPINVPSGPACSCNTDQDCPPEENCVNQACTCLSLACALPGFFPDGGEPDDGGFDAGLEDAGPADGGPDAGRADGGRVDGGIDAGTEDGGRPDAGTADAGRPDGGEPDAGFDAGPEDAGTDAGELSDAGAPDAGPVDAGVDGGETQDAGASDAN
jgi:hypothetical protein